MTIIKHAWVDPSKCSCSGVEPCHNCGAHIGCACHDAAGNPVDLDWEDETFQEVVASADYQDSINFEQPEQS